MKALAALLLMAGSVFAEENATFLKIGVGARALGMGGAYTAIAEDVSALAWNPAGLASFSKREVGAMHAELSQGMSYSFLGYAHPTRYGTFGAGAVYLSQGSLEGRDESGRLTGAYTASDSAATFSYGRKLGRRLGLGVNAKLVRSSVGDSSGQTAAFDVGGLYGLGQMGPGTASVGISIMNMGPDLSLGGGAAPLPLTFATGVSYRLPAGLTLAMDLRRRPYSGATEMSVGTEYALLTHFALRAGYASNHGPLSGSRKTSDLTGFAAGFGVRFSALSLDYSMTPYGGLGNAHRVSLGARF